ncbi:MAG: membrane protein insertion efficiency factor YidD [Candidatus Buchananbacteria bacterium]
MKNFNQVLVYFSLKLIEFYQKTLSGDHGVLKFLFPFGVCRFRPTCSEYASQALIKYGFWWGWSKAFGRILRCNPFSQGGWDAP